jgi:predicted ATP-binding protein involved in virulence
MKINRILITQLFGLYNYNLLFDNKLSFLNGTNGAGKTTVLKLIKAILNCDALIIDQIPFREVKLFVDGYKTIGVKKESVFESFSNYTFEDVYKKMISNKNNSRFPFKYNINENYYDIDISRDFLVTYLRRNIRFDQDFSNYESIGSKRIKNILSNFEVELYDNHHILEIINHDIVEDNKVHLIEANRLFNFRNNKVERKIVSESVTDCQKELKAMINNIKKKYGEKSSEIDKSIPNKLLEIYVKGKNDKASTYTINDISDQIKKLNERIKKLASVGLIQNNDSNALKKWNSRLSDYNTIEFILVYLEEMNRKLDVFDEIYDKLALFFNFMNNTCGYLDKILKINEESEIEFISNDGKRSIPLEFLSSGEKNNFILIYNLIFNLEDNTLILIDEPEISLHVQWQQNFTEFLSKLCEAKNVQSIVATHSPNIISDYYDNMVDLENASKE